MSLFPADPPAGAPTGATAAYPGAYPAAGFAGFEPPAPPPMRPRRRRRGGAIAGVLVVVLLFTAAIVAFQQRTAIRDLFTVWNYESTAVIEGYIDRSTMTEHGAFIFKASIPEIGDAQAVNDRCSAHEPGVGVLGCFITTDRSILLYDVTDDRLDGIEEVVAAHELLHAVWHRMSAQERKDAGVLLTEAAAAQNDAFQERMSVYDDLPESGRLNELHSILGTETIELTPALERYYAEWFADRAALVGLHTASNAVFVQIQDATEKLVAELDELREGIDADSERYNTGYDVLNRDIEGFNRRADAGEIPEADFDRERNALLSRQRELDLLHDDILARIDVFDAKQLELKELNAQVAELNEGLNILPQQDETPIE